MKSVIFILTITSLALGGNYTDLLKRSDESFTARLAYEIINQNKPNSNVILSAFSVLPMLGQLALASTGQTKDEILNAIAIPDDVSVRGVFRHAIGTLKTIKHVDFTLASKIYVDNDVLLNANFKHLTSTVFESEIENIDLNNPVLASSSINKWVETKTHDRIKDLVTPDELSPNPRAVLVNAIYFKGQWMKPFDVLNTKEKDFHVAPTLVKKVSIMEQKANHNYAESKNIDAKILSMDYIYGEASFVVILPNDYHGLDSLLLKLRDPIVLKEALALTDGSKVEVQVRLPKFRIETVTDLKVLTKLNINRLFSPNAQLDHLLSNSSQIHIGAAKQKAFIEIDENGTEAAAANVFISLASSLYPSKVYDFNADHPFAFFVKTRDLILFSGIYRG